MTPPMRARALIWVRLAALPALVGAAVIVGSTPDPVSDAETRVRLAGSAPATPQPVPPDDRLGAFRAPIRQPTTTTTAPPPPPTTTAPAPRRPTTTIARRTAPRPPTAFAGGVEQWRALVMGLSPPWPTPQHFRWPVDTMLRIIRCESAGDPTNYNGRTRGIPWSRNRASGLFQHLPAPDGWQDPFVSTALAYSKWSTRGLQPWAASAGCT